MERMWAGAERDYRRKLLASFEHDGAALLLDVGCDDGSWTEQVRRRLEIPVEQVHGLEIVPGRAELARGRGFHVRTGDLEDEWPFDRASFTVVHANQVIEHVKRLDHFAAEIGRVLQPGGRAVICTENLASWHNIAALLAGYMPFSLTNISTSGAIGNPFSLAMTPASELDPAWFHTRVLTGVGLTQIFDLHGLSVIEQLASGYHPLPSPIAERIARRDFRHAAFIGVVAEKAAG